MYCFRFLPGDKVGVIWRESHTQNPGSVSTQCGGQVGVLPVKKQTLETNHSFPSARLIFVCVVLHVWSMSGCLESFTSRAARVYVLFLQTHRHPNTHTSYILM